MPRRPGPGLNGWTVPVLDWTIGSVFLLGFGTILLGLPVMLVLSNSRGAEAVLPR
jgi:hypothetical protein